MASLGDVAPAAPPGVGDDDDPKKKPGQSLADVVAAPYVRPLDWQAPAPRDSYGGRGVEVGMTPDLQRVIDLPRRAPVDPESPQAAALVEYVTRKYARDRGGEPCKCQKIDRKQPCITRLRPLQAIMLHEMSLVGGAIGALFVGSGKTLIGVLAPLALPDCKTAVVLVPASLVEQFVTNYRIIAEHFRVPGLIVHRGKGKEPERFAVSDAPVTHLMSYNRLSSPDASDLLDRIAPDAIIADECDALCDTKSVRTRRFLRMYQRRPGTRFAGWTGSLTDAKIAEYATLMALALRLGSPLPLDPAVTAEWGCALDASDFPAPPGRLMDLCNPGEDVRAGFQRRLRDTAGFIASIKSDVRIEGTDELVRLGISVRPAPPLPQIIDEALKKVRLFQRPDSLAPTGPVYDDEELDDPMLQAKCAIDVASGMFHRWIFPRGEPRPLIDEWFAARKLYNKEVRELLMADVPFMDSPHLAEMAARRHHGDAPPAELIDGRPNPAEPHWSSQHWPRWRDVKDRVEPKSQAVRLHGYLVEDAAQWAHESPGIVWYGTVEFGEWLAQVSGLPLHRGGAGAGARILAEGGDRSIIASVHSHGRGRDGLQRRFSTQLYTQPFSSARNPEQWLGRLHRPGQTENLVSTYVYAHIPELRKAYRQALTRSRYVHGTLGAEQKLLTGWQGFGDEDDDDDDLF